jgi:hypothetical protein
MASRAKKAKFSRARPPRRKPPVGTAMAIIEDVKLVTDVDPAYAPQPSLYIQVQVRLLDLTPIRSTRMVIHEACLGETVYCTKTLDMIETLVAAAGRPPLDNWHTPSLKAALQGAPVTVTLGTFDVDGVGSFSTIQSITYRAPGAI